MPLLMSFMQHIYTFNNYDFIFFSSSFSCFSYKLGSFDLLYRICMTNLNKANEQQ